MKKVYLFATLFFVFLFSGRAQQIKAFAFPSEVLTDEVIAQKVEDARKSGIPKWELEKFREGLYRRMEAQADPQSQKTGGPNQVQQACTNVDFEQGNYSGWTLTSGNINGVNLPCNTCPSTAGGIANVTTSTNTGPCWTTGVDQCTGLPVVAPGGGNYSLCLNNKTSGGKIQKIQQTFSVTATNNVFTFSYLAVLQNPSHAPGDQPYFFCQILDGSGAVINCTYYLASAGNVSGWVTAPNCWGTDYKGWTTVIMDLTSYVGQNVTIQFIVSDCSLGGHYGYAYIDADCSQQVTNSTVSLCPGTTQLCGPAGYNTYSWAGPVTGSTQCLNTSTAGNYTLTPTGQCPAPVYYYTVNISPTPTVSFSSTVTPCNLTVPFTDMSNAGTGTITAWNWDFGDGTTATSSTPGNTQSHTYPAYSTYNVVLTCTNTAGCVASYSAAVTMQAAPTAAFTANTVCEGSATAFTNNSGTGMTYNWDFGDGSPPDNTMSPTHTYAAAGSYVATLTVTSSGCSGITSNTITVLPLPVLNPISAISVCDQQQIAPPAFASTPAGASVSWVNNNTAIGLAASGTGNIAPFTGTTNGSTTPVTAVVTAVPTLSGCVGPPLNFTLTVTPQPTVTLTSPPLTCPGQVVPAPTYTLNPNDPSTTFSWVNGNTATGMTGNGTGIPAAFTAAANNTLSNVSGIVTVTPTLGTCVGPPATYTVTIYPTPVINPIMNAEFCPNENSAAINFSVLPGGGSPSFTWQNSNTIIGLAGSGSGSPLPSFTTFNSGSTAQSGTISVSASLNGCPALPVPFVITINPNPAAGFSNSNRVCAGDPMLFNDLSTVGTGAVTQWSWVIDAGATFSTLQNPQYTMSEGTHSITLTATTDKGCVNVITNTVYINYIPVAAFTGGGQGCPLVTVSNLTDASTVTPPAQLATWTWNFGNGSTANTQTPGTVTYGNASPVQNAVYSISLIVASDSGCVSPVYSDPAVTVYPQPVADFSWGPNNPEADILTPTVYFYDQSQGASGQNGLQWYLGDVFLANQQNNYTNVQNPVHTYDSEDPHTYYVTQWVQNTYGCRDSITLPIEIKPNWTFYIPNAFSPNGDGLNEGFKGMGIGIDTTTYNFWIFDRWGMMVFYSTRLDESWDGRMQNKSSDVLQQDVYVWRVRFRDLAGKRHEYKGIVNLIK